MSAHESPGSQEGHLDAGQGQAVGMLSIGYTVHAMRTREPVGSGRKLGRAETLNCGGNRPGLQEGADAIMGSSGPLDADTQMGRAAEGLREGAKAIEAPAAGIEMQQQSPVRERELAAKHRQWCREANQHRPQCHITPFSATVMRGANTSF